MTLRECVTVAARTLAAAGFSREESRRDAALLARWALGWDAARWLTNQDDSAPPEVAARLRTLVERRATGEPVAYITGVREFYGRPFRVTPDVLIPRPETELVVEEALAILAAGDRQARGESLTVDVGTGSGCLAVTIALERPDLRVVATDTSRAALEIATANGRTHGVENRVQFVQSSLIPMLTTPIALVVSNPPYVPEPDRPLLPKDVRDFEPAAALFAGPDGLDIIREVVPAAANALRPGGALVMEIGQGQAPAVLALTQQTGLLVVDHIREDLQGIPRVVTAVKTSGVFLRKA